MKRMLTVLCALLIFSGAAYSQQTSSKPALGISVEFGDDFNSATPEEKKETVEVLNTALTIVQLFPPTTDNFFNWTGSKEQLKGKSLSIYYTNSTDIYIKDLTKKAGILLDGSIDTLTLILGQTETDINIYLCIFQDKVFQDEQGDKRTDGFARLVVGLAHEIYGHVPTYLKLNYAKEKPPVAKTSEISAFTKSIKFIEDVLASFKDPKEALYGLPNKDKLTKDFNSALEREKTLLKRWEEQ